MDEEHEVYGGDIPDEVEGDLEVDSDGEPDDLLLKGDDIATDEVASKVPPLFLFFFSDCTIRRSSRAVSGIRVLTSSLCWVVVHYVTGF